MAPPTHTTLDSDNEEQAPYVPPVKTDFPNCTTQALDEALDIWRLEFKAALKVPTTYGDHHDHLTDGFQLLSQLSNRLEVTEGKIVEYLTPVMKDMYFRGYKQDLHHQPLIEAYKAWRNHLEPGDFTRPEGPKLGKNRARRRKVAVPGKWLEPLDDAERDAGNLAANAKGKGKAEEGEKAKKKAPRPSGGTVASTSAAAAKPAPTPAITPARAASTGRGSKSVKSSATVDDTDDEEEDVELVNDPPCGRCRDGGYSCTVQEPPPPKKAGGKPVVVYSCAPCTRSKNKCSLVPPAAGGRKSRKVSEEVGSDDGSKAARAPRVRKKPAMTVIPAGGPGEATVSLPTGALEGLAAAEQRIKELQDEIATHRANFTRVDAEVQALKTWTTNQMLRVWEGVSGHGEKMAVTMQSVVQTVGNDQVRQREIKGLMEKLVEKLVAPPAAVEPLSTSPAPSAAPFSRPQPAPAKPRYVEIPDTPRATAEDEADTPAAAISAAPSSLLDELEEGEATGGEMEEVEASAPIPDTRQTRQASRPPTSRQGSAAPQPVRVAPRGAKRAMSVVPEEVGDVQAAKKQKTS